MYVRRGCFSNDAQRETLVDGSSSSTFTCKCHGHIVQVIAPTLCTDCMAQTSEGSEVPYAIRAMVIWTGNSIAAAIKYSIDERRTPDLI